MARFQSNFHASRDIRSSVESIKLKIEELQRLRRELSTKYCSPAIEKIASLNTREVHDKLRQELLLLKQEQMQINTAFKEQEMSELLEALKKLVSIGWKGDSALLKGKNYLERLIEASEPPLVKQYFDKKFSALNLLEQGDRDRPLGEFGQVEQLEMQVSQKLNNRPRQVRPTRPETRLPRQRRRLNQWPRVLIDLPRAQKRKVGGLVGR